MMCCGESARERGREAGRVEEGEGSARAIDWVVHEGDPRIGGLELIRAHAGAGLRGGRKERSAGGTGRTKWAKMEEFAKTCAVHDEVRQPARTDRAAKKGGTVD